MTTPTRQQAAAYRAAAPATLLDLHQRLMARMEEIAEPFWALQTRTGAERKPMVVDGWLPPMKTPTEERFPFLIVRPRTGVDSVQGAEQDATATFEITIGTYSDTPDGHHDTMQIIEAIRKSLDEQPVLADTAFEHTGPLTWDLPEQPTRPEWFGWVTTNWTIPRHRRVERRDEHEDIP